MSEMDRFEAWWNRLEVYDPTLKALACSAWMEAIRSIDEAKTQPAVEDPWVTQDRVPARVGVDEYRYESFVGDQWWTVGLNAGFTAEHHHGWKTPGGDTLLLR